MSTLFQNKLTRAILPLFAMLVFFSCQKDINNDTNGNTDIIPDLTTKVNSSSVSGFVTDENNVKVEGASVSVGSSMTTTDKYGFFEVKNVLVVKSAAVVTVNYPGYFKGIKTFLGQENKAAFFRIKLIPKTNSGNIDAATGGNVTLSNGLVVALPANAVVNATSSVAYTGSVKVAAHWIDPTSADLNQTMPGDLRGLNTAGAIKTLTTYGMVAVELTGAAGELLQIAPGKKATLTIPIPSAIIATAAGSIPLWSFDEAKGLWKEEGTAVKTGNSYVGEVSHFSFWNCDQPANYVEFSCTVKDQAGNPIAGAAVEISEVANPYNARYGYTDSSGYVSGLIPDNAQLLLRVYNSYFCGTAAYSQNFTTTSASVSLGDIIINNTTNTATVSGTVTDCSGNPVTNGYIIMTTDNQYYYRYALSSTGTYNFSTLLCSGASMVANFIAEDVISLQQSTSLTQTLTPGANAIPDLQACGTSINQFINYSIDGGAQISFVWPADSLGQSGAGASQICYIYGSRMASGGDNVTFTFPTNGIAPGGVEILESFYSSQLGTQTTTTGAPVNITEYGAIGEYISGNFVATVMGGPPTNTTYTISCNFRVRRNF